MIKVEGLKNIGDVNGRKICLNCKREMPTMNYNINKLIFDLCEDCANAMSSMFYRTMEDGFTHYYYKDEIICENSMCTCIERINNHNTIVKLANQIAKLIRR